jgi:hypothetical protein
MTLARINIKSDNISAYNSDILTFIVYFLCVICVLRCEIFL